MTKPTRPKPSTDSEGGARRARILRRVAAGGAPDTSRWFSMMHDLRPGAAPAADDCQPSFFSRWFAMAQDLREAHTRREEWSGVEVTTFKP